MSKRVLLIDDEADVHELVRLMLEKNDYDVLAVFTANEALRMVNEEKVDLILLDLRLPGMPGQDLLRILKRTRNTVDIPVIILTALEEKEAGLGCMNEGAVAYIQKPFAKKLLLREIQRCLEGKDLPTSTGTSG